jgi:deoxyribonuclease-4
MYGFHIKTKNNNINDIIKKMKELKNNNCELVQIFPDDYVNLKKYIIANKLKVILHSPFIINASQFFNNNSFTTKLLIENIKFCLNNNISTYVLHNGIVVRKHNMTTKQAINNMYKLLYYVCKTLKLNKNKDFKICLELLSGGVNDILYNINEFGKFYNILKNNKYTKNIKVCIDTCHVFSSGYDIRTIDYTKEFIKGLENNIGLENIKLIHLNDSFFELNSRKDQHEEIGKGKIGKKSLKYFFNFFYNINVNIIFECGGSIKDNLNAVLN